jgi:uncharacterized protein YqjF (DUF2071 family)
LQPAAHTTNSNDHRRVFLTAEWRDLAVLTYAIDPAALKPHLPPGLRLDDWKGQAIVSLVGFRFLHTRVLSCPVPFWGSFPEVNLRFYVTRDTPQGERRGVIFIKEIVPYYAVAAIARGLYNENYHSMTMFEDVSAERAEYRWQFEGRLNRLAVLAKGPPAMPDETSLDTFIVDHHWGYSRTRKGGLIEYEVDRVPWRTYPVAGFEVDVAVERLYGPEFAEALSKPPLSVVLAEGSGVSVSFGRKLTL